MEASLTLSAHHIDTFAFREGSGLPVVMLHGWSATADCWGYAFDDLRRDYQVIAPDLPGHGRSGGGVLAGYSVAFYRAWLADLIDGLGLEKIALMGNSLGGAISVAYALENPARVSHLVMVDALGFSEDFPWRAAGRIAGRLHHMLLAVLTRRADPYVLRFLDGLVIVNPWNSQREIIGRMAALNLPRGVWAGWPGLRVLARDFVLSGRRRGFAGRLRDINAPVLIVWGRHDGFLPPTDAEFGARLIPHAEVHIFEDSAHMPMTEEPERFNALVRRFLKKKRR